MPHEPSLIPTIAIGLSLAFVAALVARRLRLPAIVGYMVAGVLIGPFTPGFVADQEIAAELAEIGVILLMFGVGIHFSIGDLLAVRSVAVPGAIAQITVATTLGALLGISLGWGLAGGIVLGLAISVASTVVLLRALEERNEIETRHGRVAVGWLIVEDLFTVIVLVLLPSLAPLLVPGAEPAPGSAGPLADLAVALGLAAVFAVLMIGAGTRVVPALLRLVAREGSRELFTLGVLAVALGIAYLSSVFFGISLALGAFLAGVVVGESDVSHQAAADALPLRDAFAVLFFVSVGMLVDPGYLIANWPIVLAVTCIVIGAKAAAAYGIVALLRQPDRVGLTVAAGLSQIGEFSFILATVAVGLSLVPPEALQLVVAGALVSITLNPFVFRLVDPLVARLTARSSRRAPRRADALAQLPADADSDGEEALRGHAIICGYGRVGRMLLGALERRGFDAVVITDNRRDVDRLRASGVAALYGDSANVELLRAAGVDRARVLVVAMRDPQAVRLTTERAKQLNPRLPVVARTHSDIHGDELTRAGERVQPIQGELELAVQMTRYTLRRFGLSMAEAEAVAQGLRGGRPGR
jgi:CPA2 family monovalent cation:H+ antiporter-2